MHCAGSSLITVVVFHMQPLKHVQVLRADITTHRCASFPFPFIRWGIVGDPEPLWLYEPSIWSDQSTGLVAGQLTCLGTEIQLHIYVF